MKTSFIRTWLNRGDLPRGTSYAGVSLTVPDQTLSLADLISRYRRNLSVPGISVANVNGDVSIFDRLNEFERIDMARKLAYRREQLKAELKARSDAAFIARQNAANEQRIADEVAKRIAAYSNPSANGTV